jgi:hypothetical protein
MQDTQASAAEQPSGLPAEQEAAIRDLPGWKLAHDLPIPADIASWLEANQIEPSSNVELQLGQRPLKTQAYLLQNAVKQLRLVMITEGTQVFDAQITSPVIVRIARQDLESVSWKVPPAYPADADGLLYFQDSQGGTVAVVIVFNNGRAISAIPKDFRNIRLRFR